MHTVKPPRYLLREDVVRRVLAERPLGRVLEIGFGTGDLLFELSEAGDDVTGVEASRKALELARARARGRSERAPRLVSTMPPERFDTILFFEVIGYWTDPVAELKQLVQDHLSPQGRLVFSFTNLRHAGAAEELTGAMRCFEATAMRGLCAEAGATVDRMVNYGFPLTNLMKPVLNLATRMRSRQRTDIEPAERALASGFGRDYPLTRLAGWVFNPWTIQPFCWIQRAFAGTDRGTGYVAVATAGHGASGSQPDQGPGP